VSRIQSYDPAEEPLLGELAGRWYFDQLAQRFQRNRRATSPDRRKPWRPPAYGPGLESIEGDIVDVDPLSVPPNA